MAESFVNDQHDGLTHSGIVHKLLDKITTDLAVKEFRGGYQRPINIAGSPYMEYVPDSRAEYIQAIEALSDILLPKFDDVMKAEYKTYEESIKTLNEDIQDKDIVMGSEEHKKYIKKKVNLNRILFQRLNLLLQRTNYLKTSPITEEDEDDEEED